MNTRNIFKLGSLLMLVLMIFSVTAFAQQRTWYVNSSIGGDGLDGQSATTSGVSGGPKKTINRAITEANSGDIIVVASTAITYNAAANGEPATISTGAKKLTFRSTGGTPNVGSVFQVNNTLASPNNVTIFDNGTFNFSGGFKMVNGNVTGANNLTLGGTVTMTAYAAASSNPAFDVAPGAYASTVNFVYDWAAGAPAVFTTGVELAGPGINTSLSNVNVGTSGAVALTLGGSYTMKGILTTANTSTIDLGANTLTISGTNAHTIAGNVTNGTVAFTLTGAASVGGAFTLPAVTASASSAATLTLTNATTVGSVTASTKASVIVTAATTIGAASSSADNIVMSGSGVITLTAATTVNGNVVVNSQGLAVTANNQAKILFNAGAPITVNGNVTNSSSIVVSNTDNSANDGTVPTAGNGVIVFPDWNVVINGNVTNSFSITGALGSTTKSSNHGYISFANTTSTTTITGLLTVSSSTQLSGTAGTLAGHGSVYFANTTGDIRIDGGVTNSSSWVGLDAGTLGGNGVVSIIARTSGKVGLTTNKVGAITNSSSSVNGRGNGDLLFGPLAGQAATGDQNLTTVTVSGSGSGGVTQFGSGTFAASTVTNSRASAATHLTIGGSGAGLTTKTVTISSLISSGSSSTVFNTPLDAAVTISTATQMSGSGTVSFPFAGNSASWGLGALTTDGGTLDLAGTGATTGAITAKGITLNSGTVGFGAGARNFTVTGSTNTIGAAATNPTFAGGAATTLIFSNPVPTNVQTITFGAIQPTFPGNLTVDNTTGLTNAVTFNGGNFRVTGKVAFLQSGAAYGISLDGAKIFVLSSSGTADFNNVAGYTTLNNGLVSMSGATTQEVAGAGTFGDFEANAGTATTVAAATGSFTGTFYLTGGAVFNTGSNAAGTASNVVFNNSTTPPTIVVNAGAYGSAAGPTFTSSVNVTYIGNDKSTSTELPTSATKLINLTVATTNGASPSQGVVTVSVSTTVNGILTINAGQTLALTATNSITLKGATAVINGYLANRAAAVFGTSDRVVLARAAGTAITGSGVICDVEVAAGSSGNSISGVKAIINQFLGGNGAWAGGDDFDTATPASASGSVYMAAGTNSLTLTLGAGYANGTTLNNITTTNAGNTLTLGADHKMTGNLTHAAGKVDVATFTLTHRGTAPSITGGATVVGTGTLKFFVGGATTLTINTSAATIAANVEFNASVANTLTLASAGQSLTVSGNVSLTGTGTIVDIGAGRTFTASGSSLSMASGTSINATAGGGTGILRLNATTPPLTVVASGAVSIANLTVANDVTLAFTGTTPSLAVGTAFVHSGGALNFGAFDLTITGTFTRTGGTYSATTGYLIINNATFAQGASDFSVPNLRFTANSTFTGAGVVTVSSALSLRQAGTVTQQVSSVNKLTIADAATVNYRSGAFDAAPTYAGSITLVADDPASGTVISSTVWPSTGVTVTTFRLSLTTASTNTVQIPGNRTVTTTLDLRNGVLDLGTAAARTLTLADAGTVRRRHLGSVALNGGTLAFATSNVNVIYESNAASAGGDFTTGKELPSVANDITITRASNVGNAVVTINSAVTINGTLTVRNNLASSATGTITTMGNVTVALDAAYSAATSPTFAMTAPIVFGGSAGDQTITVPSGGGTVGSITINKTTGNVVLAGGNLTIGGASVAAPTVPAQLNLVSGLFMTGSNVITLSNQYNGATQGWTRNVAAGGKSHVVGNLRVPLKLGNIIPFGRNEFPVGDATYYRPAALTFVNTALGAGIDLGVTATVKYDGTRPTGIVGLPIANGVSTGVDIARYPGFSWAISTSGSLGAQPFNLELTAEGYTDFDDVANVRLIRRNGALTDVTNQWLLQGAQYDNFVISGTPTVVNVNSVGGLIQGGAIYTYGLKSTMTLANPIANVNLTDAATTFTRNLTNPALFTGAQGAITYSVAIGNPAVATVAIANNVLTVTRKVSGATSVTVTGTDGFDGSRISHTFQLSVVSDVEEPGVIPTEFTLSQNFPNPFNPSTTIRFALPKEAPVTLEIYNILGMKIRTLISSETMNAAFHTVVWDGKDDAGVGVPSGMYLYRIHADKFQASKKMTLLK